MMPAVWNVAEPLEVEYRRPIHQSIVTEVIEPKVEKR